MTKHNLSLKERFLLHVQLPESINDCWGWTGCKFSTGYGCFGRHSYAHRISFELFIGEIPDNLFVCHSCDNPGCVNPSHLFLGTHQDNMQDMIKKNRNKSIGQKGEKQGLHKLTEKDVHQIREMIEQGHTRQEIANVFGVTSENIFAIKNKRSWKWLE